MQRIAVPMIGGMISSTALTLIVIPAIYGLVKGWRLPEGDRMAAPLSVRATSLTGGFRMTDGMTAAACSENGCLLNT